MKFIIYFLSILLFSSCCKKVELSENEKEWVHPYLKGDTIYFQSNKGNIDTIVVIDKTEYYTNSKCNWFELGNIQNQGINIELKPSICRNEAYCEGIISIVKDETEETSLPFFRIFGLEYSTSSISTKLIIENVKLSSTNKTYNSCYLFQSKMNANDYGDVFLKSFYWNKKAGLIKYESISGEIFELAK